mgnify:CR=1 FL=1
MSTPSVVCPAVDVAVVGAGISGLVCAAALHRLNFTVTVLDARSRIGGRLLNAEGTGVDLGASWAFPPQETRGLKLASEMGIASIAQRVDGEAFAYQGGRAVRMGNAGERMAPCGGGAVRFKGGYAALAAGVAATLPPGALLLGSHVSALKATAAADIELEATGGVKVSYATSATTRTAVLHARRVVVAAPPGVVARSITFTPRLPAAQQRKLASTATWCGDWCKLAATFKTAFWRDAGASGVVASPAGVPISIWFEGGGGDELGDADCALVGLGVGPQCRALEGISTSEARALVIRALGGALGAELVEEQLETVAVKSWVSDPLSFAGIEAQGRDYGHSLLRAATEWGVHFAGTESEAENGHVEGAIKAGERAAREVASALKGK